VLLLRRRLERDAGILGAERVEYLGQACRDREEGVFAEFVTVTSDVAARNEPIELHVRQVRLFGVA